MMRQICHDPATIGQGWKHLGSINDSAKSGDGVNDEADLSLSCSRLCYQDRVTTRAIGGLTN